MTRAAKIHSAFVSLLVAGDDRSTDGTSEYRDSVGTKMEVIDDGGIALELKEARAKMGVLSGLNEIELEWYQTLWGFVKGLEKNGFAAAGLCPFGLFVPATRRDSLARNFLLIR